MIDELTILNLKVKSEDLLKNDLLLFPLPVNENTGEPLQIKRTAEYNNLLFTITPAGTVKLKGSIHKFKNAGQHNHDDFFYSQLLAAISELSKKFEIDPTVNYLNNIEFGVNIRTPFNPSEFIDDLLSHRDKAFNIVKNRKEHSAPVKRENYVLKIYNKSLQNNLPYYVLRIEIKTLRLEFIKSTGIRKLIDLTDKDKLQELCDLLLSKFSEIIYWDSSIKLNTIYNTKESSILKDGNNPKYWKNLKKEKGKNWNKTKRQFKELVNKYGTNEYFKLYDLIRSKWTELQEDTTNNLHLLTHFPNQNNIPQQTTREKRENTPFNISATGLKGVSEYCPVTSN